MSEWEAAWLPRSASEIVRERRKAHVAYWKEAMRAGKTICHETVKGLVIYLHEEALGFYLHASGIALLRALRLLLKAW